MLCLGELSVRLGVLCVEENKPKFHAEFAEVFAEIGEKSGKSKGLSAIRFAMCSFEE